MFPRLPFPEFTMKPILLLLISVFFSLQVQAQCDNLKPMYGDNCVKNAKQRKADDQFRKAVIKQNGTADSAAKVHVLLGWRYFYNRDAATAMKRFNQAWLLNPQNPDVYFGFGHLTRYAFAKDAAEAEKYYRLGRERDPKRTREPESLVRLLDVLDRENNLEAAIDASTQLIQGFPDFGKGFGYKKRTYYYIQAQQPDNALADGNKALEFDSQDANNYVARGYAYAWKGDSEKALADFNRALELDKNFVPAFASRAQLYSERLNKPEEALADLDQAIKLQPRKAELYLQKSDLLLKLNRKPEACATLRNGIAAGVKGLETVITERCGR